MNKKATGEPVAFFKEFYKKTRNNENWIASFCRFFDKKRNYAIMV